MKKLLLLLGLLVVVGGGCVSLGKLGGNRAVEGDWHLAFDLPSGWVMTLPYQSPNTEAVVPLQTVDRTSTEVFLQTTDKAILSGGIAAEADVPADSYVTDDYTQIRVSRLDPRRVVPSEAEDIGDGFFKLKLCEQGEDCQIYQHHNYDYYLKTEDANYKFVIYGQDVDSAEDIIKSAEVVAITAEATE